MLKPFAIRILILLLGASVVPLLAQPAPKLTSVSPSVVQRGTSVDITIQGEHLGGVTGVLIKDEVGFSVTNLSTAPKWEAPAASVESSLGGVASLQPPQRLNLRVTASGDAPLRARELRVISPTGVSNPLAVNVAVRSSLPEVTQKEPNNTVDQAQWVDLPAAISGVVKAAGQIDYYRFNATKGDDLVIDVEAARIGSELDPSIVLLDSDGKELARGDDEIGLDSLILFEVPKSGEYVLKLRDFRYRGSGKSKYRIKVGMFPYLESIFPFGGRRGTKVNVALKGRNLEGTKSMMLQIAPDAPLTPQDVRTRTARGLSNPAKFEVSDFPDMAEKEPNDKLNQANAIALPRVVNGRIGKQGDVDRFRFRSSIDQKVICEVAASRFGSSLDALLVLSDAAGKVITRNDDASQSDSRIVFDAKEGTDYTLLLRDLTRRGGEDFGYRLSISSPMAPSAVEPGFIAKFNPDLLRINRGGRATVNCELTRVGGFKGPVRLSLRGAPSGVIQEGMTLSPNSTRGLMLISAVEDASLGTFPIQLEAKGIVDGKMVTRVANPQRAYLTVLKSAPFSIDVVSLSAQMQQGESSAIQAVAFRRPGFDADITLTADGFSGKVEPTSLKGSETVGTVGLKADLKTAAGERQVMVRATATVDGYPVAQVSRPIPVTVHQFPFLVSRTRSRLMVTALSTNSGSSANEAETVIKLERRGGFTNDVTLTAEGLPDGIRLNLGNFENGASELTLSLLATEKTPVGTNTVKIVGTGMVGNRIYKHPSPPLTLIVSAPENSEESAPAAVSPEAVQAGVK